jgi:hypothetical protein
VCRIGLLTMVWLLRGAVPWDRAAWGKTMTGKRRTLIDLSRHMLASRPTMLCQPGWVRSRAPQSGWTQTSIHTSEAVDLFMRSLAR